MVKLLKTMVARDGVEPPTPAFSGLDSPVAKYHANNHLGACHFPFLLLLLEAQRKHKCGNRCLPPKLVIRSSVSTCGSVFNLAGDEPQRQSFALYPICMPNAKCPSTCFPLLRRN